MRQPNRRISSRLNFCLHSLFIFSCLLITPGIIIHAQELKFKRVLKRGTTDDYTLAVAQDKYGFIWITQQLGGLQRYDGQELKSFRHDPNNPNSPASNYIEALIIDDNNIFWLGTIDAGLDRYDPATNTFTHYRHEENNPSSIGNNHINSLLKDKSGNLWIGTEGGLDMLDTKTGKFTHYKHSSSDNESLSNDIVKIVYEDRAGVIWAGCGSPLSFLPAAAGDGGLNRLNKTTGKFTRFVHDDKDPFSLADNRVRAIFEDSKGNFWVGSGGDGLHIMDRKNGTFKHFYYDPKKPGKLSRPPQVFNNGHAIDHISFITEDADGKILIGAFFQGINHFNPADSTIKHYGPYYKAAFEIIKEDSSSGLKTGELFRVFHAKDGKLWIPTLGGDVYTVETDHPKFPYYSLNEKLPDVNSVYQEPKGNFLWAGTDQGLFRKDLHTGAIKVWLHDPLNSQSLNSDMISSIHPADNGKLWIGTSNGLALFDPVLNTFKKWQHDKGNSASLHSNSLSYVFVDKQKTVWVGFTDMGLDRMDPQGEAFTHFTYEKNKPETLSSYLVYQICEDHNGDIWVATDYGLDKIDKKDNSIHHYLSRQYITTVITDKKGVVWASDYYASVIRFDSASNTFQTFKDENLKKEINRVINIIEDAEGNLWCTQAKALIRIDEQRKNIHVYDERSGLHETTFVNGNNYVNEKGVLFLGDQSGYYQFSPALLKDKDVSPSIVFTSFLVGDKEVIAGNHQPIAIPIQIAREIKLTHNQNSFSFSFTSIDYTGEGKINYLFKLDNYDLEWHTIGTEHNAYFYNIPPGEYILAIRAIGENGAVGERTISIVITPPWWRTWWAYIMFILVFAGLLWSYIKYRSRHLVLQNRQLENKVSLRTKELKDEKEKVEGTLSALKATQAQLIQSEKMASLGQLTAGIAHEIQNPLNFVNNFSEVSAELTRELVDEVDKGNRTDVKEIAKDLVSNLEKINLHGKRADAIVKGMMEHSRQGTGEKQPTDINTLANEYLKLAYQSLRAKDKNFNVALTLDADDKVYKINVVPQDIGKVLLNLYNNAFYAVKEQAALREAQGVSYEPMVNVKTERFGDKVNITVSDNGKGIPQDIIDKIFQPFFTTKPTGQGTGLGLSLAYDIVKAHGGELTVISKEGEGSSFVVALGNI